MNSQRKPPCSRRHRSAPHAGRNDFLADAVAGDDCDAIGLHIVEFTNLRIDEFPHFVNSITSSGEPFGTRLRTNWFCSSTAIIFGSTGSSVRQKATMITLSPG